MPAGAGRIGGVLESTIASMEELGARRENIRAAVGPCIGPDAYEVGWDFERDFLERDADSRPFFSRPSPEAARISTCPATRCTACDARDWATAPVVQPALILTTDDFFSYRRSQVAWRR